ncbi:uncharacterized protein LOC144566219 [Carex rostrata]
MRLLVLLCVKKNGGIPPEFGSNSAAKSRISSSNLNEAGTNKNYAKVHDFCLGIPYGGLLFIMGLIGYIVFRSPVSMVLGVIPGFGTVALGFFSMMVWRKSKSNFIFILGQAVIAGFLARQYSQAFILVCGGEEVESDMAGCQCMVSRMGTTRRRQRQTMVAGYRKVVQGPVLLSIYLAKDQKFNLV